MADEEEGEECRAGQEEAVGTGGTFIKLADDRDWMINLYPT